MQGLPANIFKAGILRTANSLRRPAPSLFSFLGLTSTPWWDTTTMNWCSHLESKTISIKDEYLRYKQTSISDYEMKADEHSLHNGAWEWRSFIKKGTKDDVFKTRCPITANTLESIPELQTNLP